MTLFRITATIVIAALLGPAGVAAPLPRNIIFLIADGFGPAHVTAAGFARAAKFNLPRFSVNGIATTRCADRVITDSAAAATALACGVKTNYEMVGMAPDGSPLPTLLERAEKLGKVTGMVTTAAFYDATPAAFIAKAKHRSMHADIATQMLRSNVDILIGGGIKAIQREELRTMPDLARREGFSYITTRAGLDQAGPGRIFALFTEQVRDVDFPEAPLPFLARWAIERLRKEQKGFFLMVEHEGTDSSSHQNNSADVMSCLTSFDEAIGVALDFAAQSGDTLVIVTGDHETGSLRISETRTGRLRLEWATVEHTGVSVPVFAFGPGAERFRGMYDNTDIAKRLFALMPE